MNSQDAICVNVQVYAPYVTMKKYAELSGLSLTKVKQLRGSFQKILVRRGRQ